VANELQIDHYLSGYNVYGRICRGLDGLIWNGTDFESAVVAHVASYAVQMTELDLVNGGTGIYRGDLPDGIRGTIGFYNVNYFVQQGSGPSFAADPLISQQTIDWNGGSDSAVSTLFRVLPESYPAPGDGFNLPQALYEIAQNLTEFSINNLLMTIRRRDRSSQAEGYTLDSADNPTARTRTS